MARPRLLVAALLALVALAAIPVTAFVVIPLFAQRTLEEGVPGAASRPTGSAQPSAPTAAASPSPAEPRELASGDLRRIDAVHFGSGRVTIVEAGTARYVRFEQVDIAAAPNLSLYLSDRRDGDPGNYVDLGPLKATKGSFNQEITAPVDLLHVGAVVLWCRAFNVTVTYAPLETTRSPQG